MIPHHLILLNKGIVKCLKILKLARQVYLFYVRAGRYTFVMHMFPDGQAYLCSAPISWRAGYFCYAPFFGGQIYLCYVCVSWWEDLPLLCLCFLLGWSIFVLTACNTRLTVLHRYMINKGFTFTKALALHSNELFS